MKSYILDDCIRRESSTTHLRLLHIHNALQRPIFIVSYQSVRFTLLRLISPRKNLVPHFQRLLRPCQASSTSRVYCAWVHRSEAHSITSFSPRSDFCFLWYFIWRFLNNTQTTIKTIQQYKNVFRSADWLWYLTSPAPPSVSQRSRVPYRTHRYPYDYAVVERL